MKPKVLTVIGFGSRHAYPPVESSTPSGQDHSLSASAAWPKHAGADLQLSGDHCGFSLALSTADTHYRFACIAHF